MDDIRSEGKVPENLGRSSVEGQRSQIIETGWNKVLSVYGMDHVGNIKGQRVERVDLENVMTGEALVHGGLGSGGLTLEEVSPLTQACHRVWLCTASVTGKKPLLSSWQWWQQLISVADLRREPWFGGSRDPGNVYT